ncbi:MAG: retropepsin-like domain-containing protein [Acidobacteriia bacterium]|nr:retropepsin-like domain-containing protein [Terriglobia bacterium]
MQRTSRIKHISFWSPYFMPLAALLSCAWIARGQAIKATVVSAPIEGTSVSRWPRELGYKQTELYPLALTNLGCPLIEVDVDGTKIRLMLDTGTSRGFLLTNHAPETRYRIEGRHAELNADGSHRGEAAGIRVETMTVPGKVFKSVGGSLSEWTMFSSEPFDGTVGLDFFLDRRLTLDYRSRTVGTTTAPLPEKFDPKRYIIVDLIDPPGSQGHILYGRARVNGREAIVYFDTGYNVSFIDPEFSEGLASVERPGKFKIFRIVQAQQYGPNDVKL